MEKFKTKREMTLHAYTLSKHNGEGPHDSDIENLTEILSQCLSSLRTTRQRIEYIYDKDKENPKASRVIAHQRKDDDALFGSFYSFNNADLNFFLEEEALDQEGFTQKDIKKEETSTQRFGYKNDFYFFLMGGRLITTSRNFQNLEGYINYLLSGTSFDDKLSMIRTVKKPSDYDFSDIRELVFYEWVNSDIQSELVAKPKTPLKQLSQQLMKGVVDAMTFPGNSERVSYLQFKAFLTCEIEKPSCITDKEYSKQLGFALRFTEGMKGKVSFKTKNGQTIDGQSVIEKKIVFIPANSETISETELLKEMRVYAKELQKGNKT